MKKMWKRLVLTAVMLVSILMMGTGAMAGGVFSSATLLSSKYAISVNKPAEDIEIDVGWGGSLTVKSSNPKVVSAKTKTDTSEGTPTHSIVLRAKKTGTAKITITYLYDGHKFSKKISLRAYKWGNPFSTFKIGKKNLSSAFKKTDERSIAAVSGKLNIKMRSGYKLSRIYYYAADSSTGKRISAKAKVSLKSGDTLAICLNSTKDRVNGIWVYLNIK